MVMTALTPPPQLIALGQRIAQIAKNLWIKAEPLRAQGAQLWRIFKKRFKTDRDFRLATLGLGGGFIIPLLLLGLILQFMTPKELVDNLKLDPTVLVPDLNAFSDSDGEDGSIAQEKTLSPSNFRFEYFVTTDALGKLHLYSRRAKSIVSGWYPKGSPAVNFMNFFGEVLQRSGVEGETPAAAAKRHCQALPQTRIFQQNTIMCTFSHGGQHLTALTKNPRSRIFWIITLSNDGRGNIYDLQIHARLTKAS